MNNKFSQTKQVKNIDWKLNYLQVVAILQVIIVNCFNLINFSSNQVIFKGFLLFEMPLLFFVIGAVNYNSKHSYFWFLLNNFLRIIIPFLLFSLVNIFIVCCFNDWNFHWEMFYWFIPFKPINPPTVIGLNTHNMNLWFIPIYLMLTVILPILIKYHKKFCNKISFQILPLLILFLLCSIGSCFEFNYWIRYYLLCFLAYCFFTYIGLFYCEYFKNISVSSCKTLLTILCFCFIVFFILTTTTGQWDMQTNKFPPNIIFLLFGICWLLIFIIISDGIVNIFTWLRKFTFFNFHINWFTKHWYTIYLYNALAIFIFIKLFITRRTIYDFLSNHQILYVLLIFGCVLPLVLLLSYLFSFVEKLTMMFIRIINRNENYPKT